MEDGSPPKAPSTAEPDSDFHCRVSEGDWMADLRPILLVEDNPRDLELTLAALAKCQLANEIVIARDGAEALDYVYGQGDYAQRAAGDPAVILLDLKLPKVDGLEV